MTATTLDETLLRRLFATQPDEFVAARNGAAQELRRAKDRAGAAAITALRRPGWTDWALNVTAAEHGDDVAAFADAAATSRDAQAAAMEGRSGLDVRASLRDLRASTGDVVRLAGDVMQRAGRPASSADLTARLSEIAADETAAAQLLVGLLGSPQQTAHPRPPTTARRSGRKPSAADRAAPSQAASDRTAERKAAAARKAATHHMERAERDHRASMRDLARADSAVDAATGEVESATAAVAAANDVLAQAERRRQAAERRRGEVADDVTRTKSTLDLAREASTALEA